MADSEQDRPRGALRAVLGMPDSASRIRLRSLARRLRGHLEMRLAAAPSERFASDRRREIARLEESLEQAGVQTSASPRAAWIGWAAAFALGAAAASAIFLLVGIPRPGGQQDAPLSAGRISVRAEPSGSTWRLFHPEDERILAEYVADGLGHDFAPGRYRLGVANGDCPDEWEREIEVVAGERRDYAPRLCRGAGELVVRSNAEGARLQIDGMDVGVVGSQPYALPVGRHAVRVEKPGFAPWEGEIRLQADQRLLLQAEMAPIPGSDGPAVAAAPDAPPAAPARARIASGTAPGASPSGRARRERTGKGGSKSWHDAVKHQLVSDYDRNGSRSLDLPEEIQAIPCPVLVNLEASYETGGLAVGMIHLYGFDGSVAPANTLGVTSGMRGYAYDRMKACGLKTRR